jgi:hypothetical protein
MSCSLAETEEERAKRHAWAEAFWARPEEEVMRDLVFPEEERAQWTTAKWDGGYRWFKSPNVIAWRRQGRREKRNGRDKR